MAQAISSKRIHRVSIPKQFCQPFRVIVSVILRVNVTNFVYKDLMNSHGSFSPYL